MQATDTMITIARAITVVTILDSTQIDAAKALNSLHRDGDLTVEMLQQVAEAEGRKHVTRTIERIAKKLGFDSIDALMGDKTEPAELPFDIGVDHGAPEGDRSALVIIDRETGEVVGEVVVDNDGEEVDTEGQTLKDEDVADLDMARKADWLEARERAKVPKAKRPDFKTIDWEAAPVESKVPLVCTCPRCHVTTNKPDRVFGTRNTKRWTAKKGAFIVTIAQSFCRGCRSAHAKQQRAAKKAAAEAQAAKKAAAK